MSIKDSVCDAVETDEAPADSSVVEKERLADTRPVCAEFFNHVKPLNRDTSAKCLSGREAGSQPHPRRQSTSRPSLRSRPHRRGAPEGNA